MLQLCGLSTVVRNRGSPVCNCGGRPKFFDLRLPPCVSSGAWKSRGRKCGQCSRPILALTQWATLRCARRSLSCYACGRARVCSQNAKSRTGRTPNWAYNSAWFRTEYSAMRAAVECAQGRSLKDREVPSKSLIALKLEQVEDGAPVAEDLRMRV